jgi:hypothetical protein
MLGRHLSILHGAANRTTRTRVRRNGSRVAGAKSGRIQGLSSSARKDLATSTSLEKDRAASKDGQTRRRIALGAATALLLSAQGLAVLLFLRHGWDALAFPYPLNYGEGPLLDQSVRLAQLQDIYRTDLRAAPYVVSNYPPLFMLAQVPFV